MPSIEVCGSRVEYLEQGSGAPVVLLHGSGCSGAQWRALADALSERYRVIAPDLWGYGDTAHWHGREAFSLAHEAEIVHALLGHAGEPAHLVGHSYGGAVALHVARLRSDRLRSLALIEPVAFHLLVDRREVADVGGIIVRAVASGDYAGGCGVFIDYWNGLGAWDGLPAAKRAAMASRLTKVALDFHATLNEPARPEDFRSIALPTLLLRGTRSPAPTRRICETLAGVLPDSELAVIEGAGHMAPLTHRDQVNALIASHLETSGGNHAH
jgi:pimeloyl-ACP methyl ester carboxylesterase